MCAVAAIPAAIALGSAAYSSYQSKKQGEMAQASGERNAIIAEQAAEDAEQRGAIEAGQQMSKVTRIVSRQKAAMLAMGIDPASEGLRDVVQGTWETGLTDANTIRNNAAREAWSLRNNADASRIEGQIAKTRANEDAVGSLLTGVGQAASYATRSYSLKKKTDGLETN